jgi:hypothetical protein
MFLVLVIPDCTKTPILKPSNSINNALAQNSAEVHGNKSIKLIEQLP